MNLASNNNKTLPTKNPNKITFQHADIPPKKQKTKKQQQQKIPN